MEGLGLPTPPQLKGFGPAYFAFALSECPEERDKQTADLIESVEQLQRLVHGAPDESNRAVFEVSVTDIDCDEILLIHLMALNKSK
jgi:hypothetical protein